MTRLQVKQSVVQFVASVRNQSLLQNFQNGSGAHPALCEYQGLLLSMFQNKHSYTSTLLHGVDSDNFVFPILHGLYWRMKNMCGTFLKLPYMLLHSKTTNFLLSYMKFIHFSMTLFCTEKYY